MTQWNLIPISELGQVYTGRTPPSSNPEYFGEQYPFITPSDMDSRRIISTTERYLSEAGAKLLQRIKLPAKSVCVSCIGWQMGKAVMTSRPSFTNQQINSIVPNERVMPEFLYYSLKPRKDELLSLGSAIGVRTPILNKTEFSSLKIAVPSIPLQRRIVAVLSAYDDLIENNTRRITILEEMARRLYREWFVHFRFPGHEDVAMVEVEGFGRVPEGWSIVKLGEVCNLVMGQSPKSEYYNEEGVGLPFHQGVKDFGERFPVDRVYCTVENRIAETGDILFSVRAPVGRINIANKKIVVGRGLSAIRSQTGHQAFIFQQLKDKFSEEDMMGGGTIFKSVTKQDMLDIELVMPTDDVLNRFEKIMKPIFRQLAVLTLKNANLRQSRELLLPRLISGELDVSSLDIAGAA